MCRSTEERHSGGDGAGGGGSGANVGRRKVAMYTICAAVNDE